MSLAMDVQEPLKPVNKDLIQDRLRVRIKKLRVALGLSVEEVASFIGLSAQAYRARERRHSTESRQFQLPEILALAELFGRNVDDLMCLGAGFEIETDRDMGNPPTLDPTDERWREAIRFALEVSRIESETQRVALMAAVRRIAESPDYASDT